MKKTLFSPHLISTDLASLLLRLFFGGFMLLNHGLPKLGKWAEKMDTFPDPLGVGSPVSMGLTIFAELACAGLLVIGLFTRWATVPLMICMLVAALMIHAADPLSDKEHALLFFAGYAAIYLLGPGRYSIDERLG